MKKISGFDYIKDWVIWFLVMASIFMLGIIFITKSPKEYIALDRTLEQITYENDTAYINFQNDDVDYVFYEFDNITLDCLETIQPGDTVAIYVSDNYQNFTYALICKMVFNGQVLFDSAEHDIRHDQNISFIFLSTLLTSLAAILIASLRKKQKIENSDIDFEIKNSRWVYIFSLFITAAGFGGFSSFTLLYCLGRLEGDTYLFSLIFLFFLALGGLLLYVYTKEKFTLIDGVYTYSRPFRHSQSVCHTELKCVTFERTRLFPRIVFWDMNGKKAICFFDDGTAFTDDVFLNSLKKYDIPLIQQSNRRKS